MQYIPTGNVFTFGKEEADKLVSEEPENFRVLNDDYEMPVIEEKQEATYDKIVEEETKEEVKKEEKKVKSTKKTTTKKKK